MKAFFRNRTKAHCLKLLMNGFFEPDQMEKKTAMMILQTPVGQALKGKDNI